jgi:hypothetical protein
LLKWDVEVLNLYFISISLNNICSIHLDTLVLGKYMFTTGISSCLIDPFIIIQYFCVYSFWPLNLFYLILLLLLTFSFCLHGIIFPSYYFQSMHLFTGEMSFL